jgi:hypothetical protein
MKYSINVEIDEMPTTCFDCIFAKRVYCWANCPFTNESREDGMAISKNCPLKKKNKDKIYNFNVDIYK